MRWYDLFLALLVVAPPLLQYGHCTWLQRRGASPTRVAATAAAYGFAPMLPLVYAIATNLARRLRAASHNPGLVYLALLGPLIVTQALLAWSSYQVDRQSRGTDWSFRDYLRTAGRSVALQVAFFLPFTAGVAVMQPLLQLYPPLWHYVDRHGALMILLVLILFALSGVSVWRTWRWLKVDYAAVPPELAGRLTALGEQLGLVPREIRLFPTRGGKIANAFVTGFRSGRHKVLLTDYLVANFPVEEIELVFAHEVAHARLGHLRQRLWLGLATLLFFAGAMGGWEFLALRVLHLPLALALLPLVLLALLPRVLLNRFFRRQELAADAWAAAATGRPAVLATALERLDELNRLNTSELPHWLRLLVGHPITARRAAALRAMIGHGMGISDEKGS